MQSLQELCCDFGGCRAAAAFAQHPQGPGVLLCSAAAMAVGWIPMGGSQLPRGSGCSVSPAHLVIYLLLHFQRERAVRAWAQHIWANADGQVAGVHPVGLSILADVVEQREQELEQDEVWSWQLVSHPVGTQTKCHIS